MRDSPPCRVCPTGPARSARAAGRLVPDKFKKERLRLAKMVWTEFRETNSANCQHCHVFTPEIVAKQKDFVQPMHKMVLTKESTCIDCHKGVAHTAPDE